MFGISSRASLKVVSTLRFGPRDVFDRVASLSSGLVRIYCIPKPCMAWAF